MFWHILTIVFGALAAIAAICPAWIAHVFFGVLVVIFGLLALMSFLKVKKK